MNYDLVAYRVYTASKTDVYDGECVWGDVWEHPYKIVFWYAGHWILEQDAAKKHCVEHWQTFEQIREAGLEFHIFLVEGSHTQDISWKVIQHF